MKWIPIIIFCVKPILSLCFLLFGVYTYRFNKNRRKYKIYAVICVIGGLFLFLHTYSSLIEQFVYVRGFWNEHYEQYQQSDLEEIERLALDKNTSCCECDARKYYVLTGQGIEYLDSEGQRRVFAPDKLAKMDYYDRKTSKGAVFFYKMALIITTLFCLVLCIFFYAFFKKRKLKETVH